MYYIIENVHYLFELFLYFLISFCLLIILIKTNKFQKKYYLEILSKPQNIHEFSVSRIGGLVIFCILVIECLLIKNFEETLLMDIFISSIPVFLAGVFEDFTGSVKPKIRLCASLLSGFIFVTISSFSIKIVGVQFVDFFLSFELVSILLTALAISAVINSFNIIDGLNGLSLGSAILMLITTIFLSIETDNYVLKNTLLVILIPIFTLFLFNFPFGKIFIGDGGAYLLGLIVSTSSVIISQNNEIVSPFASLLIIAYPFYEMIRTIVRRKFFLNTKVMMPDNQHLHSLIYKYVLKKYDGPINNNAIASLLSLSLPLFCSFWVILFFKNSFAIIIGLIIFLILFEIFTSKFSKL